MSYYLTATETSITFHVTHVEGYNYYRFFLRPTDDTSNMIVSGTGRTSAEDFTFTVDGLDPDTWYTGNVYYRMEADSLDDQIVMGPQEIKTSASSAPVRPNDWEWTSYIAKGAPIAITFSEWNNFCARINSFRSYAGLGGYSFTTVVSGYPISSAVMNEAVTAISAIPGHGTLPSPYGAITAAFFHDIAAALNSVS